MNSLNTPSTAITTTAATTATTTTTTTTAVHFSRRARTNQSAGKVPSNIIGESKQPRIPPKAPIKKIKTNTKAPTTTELTVKPVHFSRRAPTKRTAKPKEVNIPVAKPKTCTSLPLSRIPRLTTAKTPDQPAKQPVECFTETFPIHGMIGSVLTGVEESICTDISHKSNTRMDATAAVVSFGGIAGFGSSSLTRVDDIIPPGVVADTECIGNNVDTIEVCTDIYHGSKTMTAADVVFLDGVARVYSNSTMQLDNNSVPEIVVGVECAGKSANTNGVPASTFCGNTTMTATAAIKSRRAARVNSGNSTRQNGSSLPAIVVEAKCTSKKIVATGFRVRKPRGGKLWLLLLLFWWMVMPRFARMGQTREHYIKQFDISRVGDAICKACKGVQPMQDTMLDTFCTAVGRNYPGHRNVEQVEGYSESVFLPLDTDSFKAPLSGLSVSPALSETGATAADILCHLDSATPQTQLVSYGTGHFWCVWTQDPIVDDSVEPQYCHGDVKGGQEYDGGHLLDTLASAAEYVEGRRSIDEQDAAHMSPELSQQPRYAGSICHFGCGRLPEVSNCVAAALRHCPRRWATATSCLVVQEGRHRALSYSSSSHQQHSPRSCSCSSAAAAAAPPLPASPSLLPVLISATVATPAVGSGPARANNKRAAAELTDSDTIIAAAPKRLCKS
ncbi:hypothetical protein BASA62_008453 [Batrachochytrium salamandrivorans]|nr:hypothetical protein BASA62_008453 [Batrachochytrium salamandrivorans]